MRGFMDAGTCDMGRGTSRLGAWGSGMRRLVDAGTRGRENVGTGGRETVQGLGYVGRRYSRF